MTNLLKTAFDAAAELPEEEQDAIARLVLYELESERRWQSQLDASPEILDRLAAEAVAEDAAGQTQELDSGTD